MMSFGTSWGDLARIVEHVQARLDDRLPGELLRLVLVWEGRFLRVQAEVASETARSVLLRELAAVPGAPPLLDGIAVTGYFEPATDDEWFLSRQPPLVLEAARPESEEPVRSDAERAIMRHPVMQAVGPLVPGSAIDLLVDLTLEPSAGGASALELARLRDGWRELVIDVIVTSRSFVRPAQGSIRVFEDGTSEAARLKTVLRDELVAGEGVRVSLTFFENGRHCGDWDDEVGKVVGTSHLGHGGATTPPPRLALGRSAEAPVLTVIIRQMNDRLDWLWQIRRDIEIGVGAIVGSTRLPDPSEYARALIENCPTMPPDSVTRRMISIGQDVWLKTPAEFRTVYSALRAKMGPDFTIQLILDEHSVPWELMVPDAEDGQAIYLTHPIARWPVAMGSDRALVLPTGTTCSFVPQYAANGTLPAALREGHWLEAELKAVRRTPSTEGFLALLECTDAPARVSMVHFAGHGRAAGGGAPAGLLMEDGWVVIADLNSRSAKLGWRDRPVVILNACEMADVGSELRWVSGWAPHLAQHGFGAVVAPLWRVQDEASHDVVVAGIEGLYREGIGLGAAFTRARAASAGSSSAPYAFVTYGDVMARVGA